MLMSMSFPRRPDSLVRCLFLGVVTAVTAVTSGCSDEFSDEKFGVLDLASFYDGGTQTNPAAGIPTEIPPAPGYVEGKDAEIYDFGVVPAVRNSTGVPVAVLVQPMYFFFDKQARPLFSRPVRELRDGTDWMRGGYDLLNPNPKDFCEGPTPPADCTEKNAAQRMLSYSLRVRDPLVDRNRGGADDYQRPIVDVVPGNNRPPRAQYTGLWELVTVTVPDGYELDAIKHAATLGKALDSGKFAKRHTGKVINCPIIDERTVVPRGMTSRRIFHPRIEIWYRRQLAFCFLANGWETLGNPNGDLYYADQDAERFDTFAVSRVQVGSGTELAVNVGRAYRPATYIVDEETGAPKLLNRPLGNIIVSELPRRDRNDQSAYTPMRWVFDVPAPIDYAVGTWKTVEDIDPSIARGSPVQVRNIAVRGVTLPCSFAQTPKGCGRPINNANGMQTGVDPAGDPVCNNERDPSNPKDAPLECNPDTCLCDAPFVGYGQACGVGIAQCNVKPDKFAPEGYRCFPPWGGFCQRGCDPAEPNTRSADNMGKEPQQLLDSRCGELPGFYCYAGLQTCIKFCDQNISTPGQCSAVVDVGGQPRDIQKGQTCQDFGLAVCAWPDTFTPEPFTVPE
jgi:hypothetical protein